MVSRVNRKRANGSDVRSRGCMDPRNLEGKKEDKLDILGLPKIGQSFVHAVLVWQIRVRGRQRVKSN